MANRGSAQRLAMEARAQKALDLRRMGFSYAQIAEQNGCDKKTAWRDVMRCLRRIAAETDGKAEELRALELERLDDLERAGRRVLTGHHFLLYRGRVVMDSDPKTGAAFRMTDDGPVLAAIAKLLAISESRRRLLGLDAPDRIVRADSAASPPQPLWDFSQLTDEELEQELRATLAHMEEATASMGS